MDSAHVKAAQGVRATKSEANQKKGQKLRARAEPIIFSTIKTCFIDKLLWGLLRQFIKETSEWEEKIFRNLISFVLETAPNGEGKVTPMKESHKCWYFTMPWILLKD